MIAIFVVFNHMRDTNLISLYKVTMLFVYIYISKTINSKYKFSILILSKESISHMNLITYGETS